MKKKKYYALVDCNNFYVSCERVFNPKLKDKPVLILSNNDGCVVARSDEVKKLGIPMGVPFFQVKQLCLQHKVIVFSSNFALYGDMSWRVMQILKEMSERLEIYSIDEAFLEFNDVADPEQLLEMAHAIKATIAQWIGLPVSIGLAATKTLAKVANRIAKHSSTGIFALFGEEVRLCALKNLPLSQIWGIGARWEKQLNQKGLYTAWDLAQLDPYYIKKQFGVVLGRIIYELNGVPVLSSNLVAARKSILSSRSFGQPVTEFRDLLEAASCYAQQACTKLRRQGSVARAVQIFLKIKPSDPKSRHYYDKQSLIYSLPEPTADSRTIIKIIRHCLEKVYQPDTIYKKVGVLLLDLSSAQHGQASWLALEPPKAKQVMHVMDEINQRMGANTLFIASQGTCQRWKGRKNHCSPSYTSRWDALLEVG